VGIGLRSKEHASKWRRGVWRLNGDNCRLLNANDNEGKAHQGGNVALKVVQRKKMQDGKTVR